MKKQATNDPRFDAFWAEYPRREAKIEAQREWKKLKVDDALLQTMLDALAWQKKTPSWLDGFAPHARRWLHNKRWLDEPFNPPNGANLSLKQTFQLTDKYAHLRGTLSRSEK